MNEENIYDYSFGEAIRDTLDYNARYEEEEGEDEEEGEGDEIAYTDGE